jgi:hypothetical protein
MGADLDVLGREVQRFEIRTVYRLKRGTPAPAIHLHVHVPDRQTGTEQDITLLIPAGLAHRVAVRLEQWANSMLRQAESDR